MVEQGTFRADLYHRLHVLSVHLPAMRERKADVALLVDHFLAKYQPLAPVQGLSVDPSFVAALEQCDWPGNVRQLENTIRQAVVEKENDACLRWQDLPADILRQLARRGESGGPDRDLDRSPCERVPSRDGTGLLTSALSVLFEDKGWNLRRCLAQCEKTLLVAALARNDYNQARAARQLGITARSMYNKMCKHALRRNSDALPAERVAPGVCEPTNTSWTRRAATSTA
jgi:transcriptional regulator with PAS, ATPase and Fis domain